MLVEATLAGFNSELEKIALTRWQKEMQQGNLGQSELQRLPNDVTKIQNTEQGKRHLRYARQAMWGPGATDLTPAQLARHRQLNAHLAVANLKSVGGSATTGLTHFNGRTGDIAVNPQVGQELRALRHEPRRVELEDPTVFRGAVAHEIGEKSVFTAPDVPLNRTATHFGPSPLVMEAQSLYRDPDAQRLFESGQLLNQDDAFTLKKMRQFGHRPDSPMPVGGRGQVALERAVAKRAPTTPQAYSGRLLDSVAGKGHGLPLPTEFPRVQTALTSVGGVLSKAGDWLKRSPLGQHSMNVFGKALRLERHGRELQGALSALPGTLPKDPSLGGALKGLTSQIPRRLFPR